MKKHTMQVLFTAALAALALSASAQTTISSTWNGSGTVTFDASTANSTHVNVMSSGYTINGAATYVNNGDNPYGYGVATTKFDVNASVAGGGYVQSAVTRTGSGAMYGAAGQSITAYASSTDGNAALVQHTNVNYASMNDIGYGQSRTALGNTMDASGSAYTLNYVVNTGAANNNGGFVANGSGSGAVVLASSGVSANGFAMGTGQGIYTQANYSYNGVGTFSYGGVATNNLTVHGTGNTLPGTAANPASVNVVGSYAGAGTWNNFAISGAK